MSIGFALFLLICSGITIILWTIFIKCYNEEEKEAVAFGAILMLMTTLTIYMFIVAFIDNRHITPIDVYRGKTTLEITYKDSIAIDSVVVWKEDIK